MAESLNYFITTKLDRFYQQFLHAHFGTELIPFKFPKDHDLETALICFLTERPEEECKVCDYGEDTFRIAIPAMHHKDPRLYNYMSEVKQRLFMKRVRNFYQHIIHDQIGKLRQKGFDRTEIVYMLIEDYKWSLDDFDRITKEYNRWLDAEKNRRYRLRQKRKKNAKIFS